VPRRHVRRDQRSISERCASLVRRKTATSPTTATGLPIWIGDAAFKLELAGQHPAGHRHGETVVGEAEDQRVHLVSPSSRLAIFSHRMTQDSEIPKLRAT